MVKRLFFFFFVLADGFNFEIPSGSHSISDERQKVTSDTRAHRPGSSHVWNRTPQPHICARMKLRVSLLTNSAIGDGEGKQGL